MDIAKCVECIFCLLKTLKVMHIVKKIVTCSIIGVMVIIGIVSFADNKNEVKKIVRKFKKKVM